MDVDGREGGSLVTRLSEVRGDPNDELMGKF